MKEEEIHDPLKRVLIHANGIGRVLAGKESRSHKAAFIEIMEELVRRDLREIIGKGERVLAKELAIKKEDAKQENRRMCADIARQRMEIKAASRRQVDDLQRQVNHLRSKLERFRDNMLQSDRFKAELKRLLSDRMPKDEYISLMEEVAVNVNQEDK